MFVFIIFVALTHICSVVAEIFDIDIQNLDILAIRDRYFPPMRMDRRSRSRNIENVVPHLRIFPCPYLVE